MDCSGAIFSLVDDAATTGANYSFALNRYWGPGHSPMWDQSYGVLHSAWVGSNGEGNILIWGPHWYGLPNLTEDDPIWLELAEGAIWFGYNLGGLPTPTITMLDQLQCFGDTDNLIVQGTEKMLDGFEWEFPQQVYIWFKKFVLTPELLKEIAGGLHTLKPKS
jgi:hypothetical protein